MLSNRNVHARIYHATATTTDYGQYITNRVLSTIMDIASYFNIAEDDGLSEKHYFTS